MYIIQKLRVVQIGSLQYHPYPETPPPAYLHKFALYSGFVRVTPEQLSATLQFIRILQTVVNPTTYPNVLQFLALHKCTVEEIKTQMTFSVSRESGAFEWADDVRGVFCQPRRAFDFGT